MVKLARLVPRFKTIGKAVTIGLIALSIAIVGIATVLPVNLVRADNVDLYWHPVGDGTGNWSDVNNWCTAADGTGRGHAAPTSTNNVSFGPESFNAPGQTVTVDVSSSCKNMDWTGATNTPTLTKSGFVPINFYGDITLISGMTTTNVYINAVGSNSKTLITAGKTISVLRSANGTHTTGTLILGDNLTIGADISWQSGTLNTNNKTIVSCPLLAFEDVGSKTGTFGSSIINVTTWSAVATTTLTANTSTINCSGNFSGGGLTTYNIVNLTGSTSTITGNNSFATLGFTRAGVQTITFTDGSTQTVTNLTRDAGTAVKTLRGSAAAGWNIAKAGGGKTEINYASISRSAASPADSFYAGTTSTDGGNNSGWVFNDMYVPSIATNAFTNIGINLNGVTSGKMNGTISDLGGAVGVSSWFEYGVTTSYGFNTTHIVRPVGTYSENIPTNLKPNAVYHFRSAASNGVGTVYGADELFIFTTPPALGMAYLAPLFFLLIGITMIFAAVSTGKADVTTFMLIGISFFMIVVGVQIINSAIP
jgi:hypothetical protein